MAWGEFWIGGKMIIELKEEAILNFIREYGVDNYEYCPCGSGKKYKWCCKENATPCKNNSELKKFYHDLKIEIWNRRKWKTQQCHWNGCHENTQRCHSIQNNRFLNQIYGPSKEVYHFIPMGSVETEIVELEAETVSFASTFNGFCNTHDRELFSIIEGNNQVTFSLEQKYALVYRNFYYMLCKKEIIQQIILRASLRGNPRYYSKDFKPRTSQEAKTVIDLILDMRKNQIMFHELQEIISDIESNYNQSSKSWVIQNPSLIFSNVRTIRVANPKFCFQTAREYLSEDEVAQMNFTPTIHDFINKRYNHISTIILPDVQSEQISVFFAISKKHTTKSPSEFIEYIDKCTDEQVIEILNNILIDAYEELYLSKDAFLKCYSSEEQTQLKEILTRQTFKDDSTTLMSNILSEPQFHFIKIQHS